MTIAAITDYARPLVLRRDAACLREVVARRHGPRAEPGTDDASELAPNTHRPVPTPRSALGQKSRLLHSIANSETPQGLLAVRVSWEDAVIRIETRTEPDG